MAMITTGGVPAIQLCLAVGVTGHRDVTAEAVTHRLTEVLAGLRAAAMAVGDGAPPFAAAPGVTRLICALADGADQLAADAALGVGYELHAVLPFARADYVGDFEPGAAQERFAALLARAARVFELPCTRDAGTSAYVLAGRATVAHCDVLVAVWDGLRARGAGGTAEIVEHALRRDVPVIHVPVDAALPVRLIWSAHEPHLLQARVEEIAAVPVDAGAYRQLVQRLLSPPADPVEAAHLAGFLAERARRFTPRIEYPLLLALAGVKRLRRTVLWSPPYLPAGVGAGIEADDGAATWRQAFAWSDGLAAHLAQTYRSGHVFNFFAGALAVLLGLSGLVVPQVKLWLAFAELAVIAGFVVNTRVGVARNWHRRWLDYRLLAERLRPMASLAALGIAQPDRQPPVRRANNWVDWYAAGVWRSLGLPAGTMRRDVAAQTADLVAGEIAPQIAYHRGVAASAQRFDHRLHRAGTLLFAVSCLSCVAFIVAYVVDHGWTVAHAADFVALSAGLPAVGTAFFGIRVQGDFAGTAARSAVTADHLAAIAAALEGPVLLSRTADGMEAAARAMVADLGEWRLSHQQRQLELG